MKHLSLLSIIILLGFVATAQTSLTFPYQALVRDASGNPLPNQPIGAQITLFQDSVSESHIVYTENHQATTNGFGQLELLIGSKDSTAFETIDWGAGLMFIKLEIDITGGTAYQEIGTHQLLAVPYALYAEEGSGWRKTDGGISYLDGNVGIGNVNPQYYLDITAKAYDLTREEIIKIGVEDAPSDNLIFGNATGNNGTFLPYIQGQNLSNDFGSLFIGAMTNEELDTISYRPLMWFDARKIDGPVQNRILFQWTSYYEKHMTMLANGNVGIGTTNPNGFKLNVAGDFHANNVKTNSLDLETYLEKRNNQTLCNPSDIDITEIQNIIEQDTTIDLGKMNIFLLEKIDQLIQSNIQQQKEIENQKIKNAELRNLFSELKSEIENLKNK